MAYDAGLAERIGRLLRDRDGVSEKKMFGGIAFFIDGNMCCGVVQDDLIVRVGPEAEAGLHPQPHAKPFDMTGRPMKGWIAVEPAGVAEDEALAQWVARGVAFAASLPAK